MMISLVFYVFLFSSVVFDDNVEELVVPPGQEYSSTLLNTTKMKNVCCDMKYEYDRNLNEVKNYWIY